MQLDADVGGSSPVGFSDGKSKGGVDSFRLLMRLTNDNFPT